MRKLTAFLCAMVLVFGAVGIVNAILWDRGGGLIYDDVLDITWLQDANYGAGSSYDDGSDITDGQMTWTNAVLWADTLLYYDSARDVTWDGWRLPDAHNQDGSGPVSGYFVTDSELGHMCYNNLGASAGGGIHLPIFTDGNGDRVSFNLYAYMTWSGTEYAPNQDYAWHVDFNTGFQGIDTKDDFGLAWAVRDGDVGATPVPEPSTIYLVGTALFGMLAFGRKKLFNN